MVDLPSGRDGVNVVGHAELELKTERDPVVILFLCMAETSVMEIQSTLKFAILICAGLMETILHGQSLVLVAKAVLVVK